MIPIKDKYKKEEKGLTCRRREKSDSIIIPFKHLQNILGRKETSKQNLTACNFLMHVFTLSLCKSRGSVLSVF